MFGVQESQRHVAAEGAKQRATLPYEDGDGCDDEIIDQFFP
jgi:hypothetical protein